MVNIMIFCFSPHFPRISLHYIRGYKHIIATRLVEARRAEMFVNHNVNRGKSSSAYKIGDFIPLENFFANSLIPILYAVKILFFRLFLLLFLYFFFPCIAVVQSFYNNICNIKIFITVKYSS